MVPTTVDFRGNGWRRARAVERERGKPLPRVITQNNLRNGKSPRCNRTQIQYYSSLTAQTNDPHPTHSPSPPELDRQQWCRKKTETKKGTNERANQRMVNPKKMKKTTTNKRKKQKNIRRKMSTLICFLFNEITNFFWLFPCEISFA